MRRDRVPCFQFLIFAGHRSRLLDFRGVSAEPRGFLGGRHGFRKAFLLLTQFCKFAPDGAHFREFRVKPAETVQHVKLILVFQELVILACAVNIHQNLTDPVQDLKRHRRLIHKIPAGGCGNDTAHQQISGRIGLNSRFIQNRFHAGCGTVADKKLAGDFTTVGPDTDRRLVRTPAEQKPDSAHDDRFSGAGLSRNHIESRSEFHIRLVNKRKVLQTHPFQHVFPYPV